MGYGERNTWVGMVVGLLGLIVYIAWIGPQAGAGPVEEIDWVGPMLWTIGGAIAIAVVGGILWSIVAGMRDPEERHIEDVRDREIARLGDRVGQAFLVIGMLGALVLCAARADWFWIANALYLAFALSAIIGGIARVIVYRGGMP
ncbi:hypothetical protein J4H92_07470 [Leucobacter weissii]|uniref:DUF2178 domain-containing protein n=1 Tax=Leucobacter weissii TaxID=1983706 RepID=A0A939MRQ7_9MICO|nr:hypothetical protein [Leucobacter weissii]MBO1901789.1 hypothetical protein [Leucobacter weissii]